jgi:N-dimethylarginine dimethylaminohydrolase
LKDLAQADSGTLRRVMVKRVRDAFGDPAAVDRQWRALGWAAAPDAARAAAESDALCALLEARGVTVEYAPSAPGVGLDSLYVRDAAVVCDRGAILCRMGKPERRAEPAALGAVFETLGVPVVGAIAAPGILEGGDVTWLGPRTVAVGHGYRTNAAGIEQLRALLGDAVEEVIVAPLPHHRGPGDVFHLMSILSPLDASPARRLALAFSPLMPVTLRQALLDRGWRLVEAAAEELDTLGCNTLALAPGTCLLAAGNPRTRRRLERAGVEVVEFAGAEMAVKGGGGPTCLTRPLAWTPAPDPADA